MLTILERLHAHCFPTTFKTLFISKPEQHHRMTRHHYCPCNNSWIEPYAFFLTTTSEAPISCGRFIANTWRQQFFLFYTYVRNSNQIFQAWWLVKLQWEFFILLCTWIVVPSCKAFVNILKNVDIHLNRAQAGRSRLTACVRASCKLQVRFRVLLFCCSFLRVILLNLF